VVAEQPEQKVIRVNPVSYSSLLALALFQNDKVLSQATGFVARHHGDLYFVTNWHVVTGRDPTTGTTLSDTGAVPETLAILHTRSWERITWEFQTEPLYDEQGDPLWLEHPRFRRSVDVVALPLTERANVYYSPYDPADTGPAVRLGPTAPVSIVGFPFGRTAGGSLAIWVQGTLASEPSVDFEELPCMLVDSRTRSGQSGSPVVAHRVGTWSSDDGSAYVTSGSVTRFVGVYSGRINKESDLGRVWKVQALLDIIEGEQRGPFPTVGG
jgi:hypothetical protein